MKKAFLVVLMLSSSLIFAQNNISGSVSDESGNPVPGATVVVREQIQVLLQTLMVIIK